MLYSKLWCKVGSWRDQSWRKGQEAWTEMGGGLPSPDSPTTWASPDGYYSLDLDLESERARRPFATNLLLTLRPSFKQEIEIFLPPPFPSHHQHQPLPLSVSLVLPVLSFIRTFSSPLLIRRKSGGKGKNTDSSVPHCSLLQYLLPSPNPSGCAVVVHVFSPDTLSDFKHTQLVARPYCFPQHLLTFLSSQLPPAFSLPPFPLLFFRSRLRFPPPAGKCHPSPIVVVSPLRSKATPPLPRHILRPCKLYGFLPGVSVAR